MSGAAEQMSQVNLTINGRSYSVSCGDGEEAYIQSLAADIDQRVQTLVEQLGAVGEARLLVMTALLVADELAEARGEKGGGAPSLDGEVSKDLKKKAAELEAEEKRLNEVAAQLDRYAEKLEAIAAKLVDA
jgi:cell division protein ZapA